MPRFHCPAPLATGLELDLPPGATRHVQVLRLQPGDALMLFNGEGGEFEATVLKMGRSDVRVLVGTHHAVEREAPRAVHLLAGITANERMDWLVEKATELGVASITPLVAERSVLKLKGERADKKIAHWQAVAVAACEQCGRNRVPAVHAAVDLAAWVRNTAAQPAAAVAAATTAGADPAPQRLLLSLRAGTAALQSAAGHSNSAGSAAPVLFLSGPEGGLSAQEEDLAIAHHFAPVTLGPRVLRAETAPLAALAALTLA
ncbi:16S rRNA (uracil(1498)-N(3))-methyltransferase [Acidovorax sp.]|uniref:16S rRNA (uracil(1498)-N(3))-methyltransferase n=1 Tax=Acidovorax sp. TaxID=1872122 RepID=UPI00391C4EBF